MKRLLNLSNHDLTSAQGALADEAPPDVRERILALHKFGGNPPALNEIRYRAMQLACIAHELGYRRAVVGGAPWLIPELVTYLDELGITPVFSFSRRGDDGRMQHVGWLEV